MTAAELIEELKRYPGWMPVRVAIATESEDDEDRATVDAVSFEGNHLLISAED